MTQTKKLQSGLTLIELMVAMVIALIALGAGGALYLTSSQTNRVLQMQNHLAEDGRFTLHMLQRLISQAGYRGGTGTARASDYFAATSGTAFSVKFDADGTNLIGCNGAPAVAGVTTLAVQKSGTSLTCGGTTWVGPLGGSAQGTEVADFRVEYGVDTTPSTVATPAIACGGGTRDCVADSYATSLGGVSVNNLVAVRVCLVLRTENTNSSLRNKASVSDCSGTAIANSQTDEKLYRTFNSTILLRNL